MNALTRNEQQAISRAVLEILRVAGPLTRRARSI